MTRAEFWLAELAQIGPYFVLRDGGRAGGNVGFEPVTALITDTPRAAALLDGRIDDVWCWTALDSARWANSSAMPGRNLPSCAATASGGSHPEASAMRARPAAATPGWPAGAAAAIAI